MRIPCLVLLTLILPSVARAINPTPRSEFGRYHREITELPKEPIVELNTGGHTAKIRKVVFAPGDREIISVSEDKTIRVWDVASGESIQVLRPPSAPGPEGMLYALAISPDGRTLAVGGYGKLGGQHVPIYLIAMSSGRITSVLRKHRVEINSLAFSPDGKILASGSGDGATVIWDVQGRKPLRELAGRGGSVADVGFSPDGSRLATACSDGTVHIWSVSTGNVEAVLRGHKGRVLCVAWRPDGSGLASGGVDQTVRLWSPEGRPLKSFEGLGGQVTSLAFSPDSRRLLITRGYGSFICSFVDSSTGEEQLRFDRHDNTIMDGALSSDGRLAATAGGNDQYINVWRTDNAVVVHRLIGRGRNIWAAGWSADGGSIGWSSDWTGGSLFRATTGLNRSFHLANLEFGPAPGASFQRARLSQGNLTVGPGRSQGQLEVREGGSVLTTLDSSSETDLIRSATLLADGRIAMGASYGLYLFPNPVQRDPGNVRRPGELIGHTGAVWAVAPSPDGRYLLSCSDDQTLRIWNVRSAPSAPVEGGELLLSLFFSGNEWVAWTPQGYYAASPGGEEMMGWHVNDGLDRMATFYPAVLFRNSLYRPDVIRLLLSTGGVKSAIRLADQGRDGKAEPTEVNDVLPPKVAIVSPDQTPWKRDVAELEVEAKASSVGSHPVTALRLLMDGRPYKGKASLHRIDKPKLGEVRASWKVRKVPGTHQLAAQAESPVSEAVSEAVEVTFENVRGVERVLAQPEWGEVQLPSLYVLAVGISEYPGDLKLNYAARDAEVLAQTYREKSKELFRKVEVRVLTDGRATRRDVLRGLSWLREQMTQNDVAVFSFAGHGFKDAGGRLSLLPVDGEVDDLLSSAVSGNQLKDTLAEIPGRVMVFLDACHAGAVDGERRRGGTSLTDDLVRDLKTNDFGVIVFCSSVGREVSIESPTVKHGYFTHALVEGLTGKADYNNDGVVYWTEVDLYVTEQVKVLTGGRQHPVTAKSGNIRSFPLTKPSDSNPAGDRRGQPGTQ